MIQKQFSLKLGIRSFFEVGRVRSSPTFGASPTSSTSVATSSSQPSVVDNPSIFPISAPNLVVCQGCFEGLKTLKILEKWAL